MPAKTIISANGIKKQGFGGEQDGTQISCIVEVLRDLLVLGGRENDRLLGQMGDGGELLCQGQMYVPSKRLGEDGQKRNDVLPLLRSVGTAQAIILQGNSALTICQGAVLMQENATRLEKCGKLWYNVANE